MSFQATIINNYQKLRKTQSHEKALNAAVSSTMKRFGIQSPKTIKGDLDSLMLKNQPIARAGVLPYSDGRKLKRWQDLQKNIGRVVPVLNEHPAVTNGNAGLYSGQEQVHGYAEIVACPRGGEVLCANIKLLDNAPVKRGVSIGYPYENIAEPGEFNGQQYDAIQGDLLIDHLALTDSPRDDKALKIMADSTAILPLPGILMTGIDSIINNDHNNLININAVGYDTLEFVDLDYQITIAEIAKKLAADNPAADYDEIMNNATMMFINQQELQKTEVKSMPNKAQDQADMTPEEKKKKEEEAAKDKKGCDSIPDTSDRDGLVRENAELKEKIRALDSIKSLEGQYKAALDSLAQKDKALEMYRQKELQSDIQELITKHGADSKEFDGKTPDFIAGALYWARQVNTEDPKPGKKVPVAAGDAITKPVKNGPITTNKAGERWSHKQNKFVEADSWDG